jgi:hypothetical protein
MTKIYNLVLLRASESTLSRWSRLHLQSLAPMTSGKRPVVKISNCRILSQHDEKNVVPTPLSEIRVRGTLKKDIIYHSDQNKNESTL